MARLQDFKNLAILDISDTAVTDEGVARLRELKSLASLDLEGTDLTDAGIEYLSELPNLGLLRSDELRLLQRQSRSCRKHFRN